MTSTVLIVDDEDAARSFVNGALSDAGYEAIEAGYLAQAQQASESGAAVIVPFDGVLSDGSGLAPLALSAQ